MVRYVMFHLKQLQQRKRLQDGGEVVGVLVGESCSIALGEELIHYGADRVVTVEHANLNNIHQMDMLKHFIAVIEARKSRRNCLWSYCIRKDLSPKIASKLESGLISDVTAIEEAGGNVVFTRPIYSGKAFEKKIITDGIIFATIRPNNIAPLEKDESRTGEVSSFQLILKIYVQLLKKLFVKRLKVLIFLKRK